MMKTLRSSLLLAATASSLLLSCQREESKLPVSAAQYRFQQADGTVQGTSTAGMRVSNVPLPAQCQEPYSITLESTTANGNGTYTWIWSLKNPAPGNGTNGTVQDLSHWDIVLNNCCSPCSGGSTGAQLSDIVSAATSTNGTSWQSFTPTLQQDPSVLNSCGLSTGPVLKFDVGTTGSAKIYYRLIVSRNFQVYENAASVYKSGKRTGCGTICYPGMGCPE